MPFVLNEHNSIANHFLFEMRDQHIQKDRMRFRRNMERLGEILAYEISKKLTYKGSTVSTPLGVSKINILAHQPVLISILRAGLPFFQGFQNFFDKADAGFIGAYRVEDGNHLTIKLDYVATNSLVDKTIILIDPMLATGRSVIDTIKTITKNGAPEHIHIASLVAAPEGINYLKSNIQSPYSLWTCALDERLNDQNYIVPGLGDAGDLSFGTKC